VRAARESLADEDKQAKRNETQYRQTRQQANKQTNRQFGPPARLRKRRKPTPCARDGNRNPSGARLLAQQPAMSTGAHQRCEVVCAQGEWRTRVGACAPVTRRGRASGRRGAPPPRRRGGDSRPGGTAHAEPRLL
jgi:hypothetical protein